MKKILVVGGSYFAGRVFVEELAKRKDVELHVVNRGRIRLGIEGVVEHRGDREDVAQLRNAVPEAQWDAVVDFCAYTPSHVESLLGNLRGTIGQYVFISTTSIYGNSQELPIREEAFKVAGPQPELGDYASYGYDKWRAECALRKACGRAGIPYTILRPAIIYGFYNYAPRERYFFDLLQAKEPVVVPECGLALFNFIWVVDMARILIRCLGEPKALDQEFNLCSDELIGYPRIVEVLEEISGRKIAVQRKSVEAIDRERIPLPFPLREHLVYSGAKLQRALSFDATPFATGMRESYGYYRLVQRKRQEAAAGEG